MLFRGILQVILGVTLDHAARIVPIILGGLGVTFLGNLSSDIGHVFKTRLSRSERLCNLQVLAKDSVPPLNSMRL
jgi:hypothetical protein